MCTCEITMSVEITSSDLNAINNVTRRTGINTFHITDICPWTMSVTLHIYVPLHFYHILQMDTTLLHISIKQNICQQQIYPFNAINMLFAQITWCAFMGQVCQFICHTWSCSHLWCSQIHYSQTMMTRCHWWCQSLSAYVELATWPNQSRNTQPLEVVRLDYLQNKSSKGNTENV